MAISSGSATDVGRKRSANEDSVLAHDDLGLYIVADGMGGHSCGDVASQTVVEVIRGKLEISKSKGRLKDDPGGELKAALELANKAVWELGQSMSGCKSMGTTVNAVIFGKNCFFTANVGDSRSYRISGTAIERLTTDHSLVEEQVAIGAITRDEARTSPVRNVITRAMGQDEDVEVDLLRHEYKKNDMILLCSDGLSGMVDDDAICKLVVEHGTNDLTRGVIALIESANDNGGTDNISVVLIRM